MPTIVFYDCLGSPGGLSSGLRDAREGVDGWMGGCRLEALLCVCRRLASEYSGYITSERWAATTRGPEDGLRGVETASPSAGEDTKAQEEEKWAWEHFGDSVRLKCRLARVGLSPAHHQLRPTVDPRPRFSTT